MIIIVTGMELVNVRRLELMVI